MPQVAINGNGNGNTLCRMTATVRFQDIAGKLLAEDRFELIRGSLRLSHVASWLGAEVDTLRYVDISAMAAVHENGLTVRVFSDGALVRFTGELERCRRMFAYSVTNALWPARPKVE